MYRSILSWATKKNLASHILQLVWHDLLLTVTSFTNVNVKICNSLQYITNLCPCYNLLTCTCTIRDRFLQAIHGWWDCHIQEWIVIKCNPCLNEADTKQSVTLPELDHSAARHVHCYNLTLTLLDTSSESRYVYRKQWKCNELKALQYSDNVSNIHPHDATYH
jgi:hypothetical protein